MWKIFDASVRLVLAARQSKIFIVWGLLLISINISLPFNENNFVDYDSLDFKNTSSVFRAILYTLYALGCLDVRA